MMFIGFGDSSHPVVVRCRQCRARIAMSSSYSVKDPRGRTAARLDLPGSDHDLVALDRARRAPILRIPCGFRLRGGGGSEPPTGQICVNGGCESPASSLRCAVRDDAQPTKKCICERKPRELVKTISKPYDMFPRDGAFESITGQGDGSFVAREGMRKG